MYLATLWSLRKIALMDLEYSRQFRAKLGPLIGRVELGPCTTVRCLPVKGFWLKDRGDQ